MAEFATWPRRFAVQVKARPGEFQDGLDRGQRTYQVDHSMLGTRCCRAKWPAENRAQVVLELTGLRTLD